MKNLIIITEFPEAVRELLVQHELVERGSMAVLPEQTMLIGGYPDDALSQELVFWFAMAQGCGLVAEYRLAK